jgi:hypothetical protein
MGEDVVGEIRRSGIGEGVRTIEVKRHDEPGTHHVQRTVEHGSHGPARVNSDRR